MMKKMMERARMIRENQKKNGKKGFSMIELIIVIAIMAILVALIGTQLIPYLEKSRKTRDFDTLNAVLTAAQSVVTDHEIDPTKSTGNGSLADITGTYKTEFENYLGYKWADAGSKYTSNAAGSSTPTITAATDKSGNNVIKVTVGKLYVTSGGEKGETTTTTGGSGS